MLRKWRPRRILLKVFPRDRMLTLDDERQLLASCPRPLKDVLIIMLDSGLRNGEAIRMRLEDINWKNAFYFNPKGKTRKARRLVPLSERVIALLRNIQLEQLGQTEGWVFPSKKSTSGHIGLSDLSNSQRDQIGKVFAVRSRWSGANASSNAPACRTTRQATHRTCVAGRRPSFGRVRGVALSFR
jgi:integrase